MLDSPFLDSLYDLFHTALYDLSLDPFYYFHRHTPHHLHAAHRLHDPYTPLLDCLYLSLDLCYSVVVVMAHVQNQWVVTWIFL